MKTYFLFIMLCVAVIAHAQSPYQAFSKRMKIAENSWNDRDYLVHTNNYAENTREVVVVPLSEVDSSYDNVNGTWFYTEDVKHQYYSGNCKDSIITHSENGNLIRRDILKWDSTAQFEIDELSQLWNGTNWVNDVDFETPVQFGCYILATIFKGWNGASWDTVSGTKENLVFDSVGRVSERDYSSYVNHQWISSRKVFMHYGTDDILTGMEDFHYSTTTGNLTSGRRDTNYVWQYFNTFCHRFALAYETQYYDISSGNWINDYLNQTTKEISGSDTIVNYVYSDWNGSAYDTTDGNIQVTDYMGNLTKLTLMDFDTVNHSWIIIFDSDDKYTYGANDETLRHERLSYDCSSNYDSVVSCYVQNYSNFTSCDVATGFSELNTQDNGITIFPNPAQDVLTIHSSKEMQNTTIEVYSVNGRKLLTASSFQGYTAQLNTAGLPSGIFILEILDAKDGKIARKKFVKE